MIPLSEVIRTPDHSIKVQKIVKEPHRYQVSVVSTKATTKPAPQVYVVKIECNTEKLTPKSKIKGYCDCHDFRYRQAYCWYERGALIMPQSFLLEPPKITNPGCGELRMCKHMTLAVSYILNRNL